MCRNIRVLHDFEPPTTADEIRAAALQYVRKVSGTVKPNRHDEAAFERAVDEVTRATAKLLAGLARRTEPRTRELERERAKAKWAKRIARA